MESPEILPELARASTLPGSFYTSQQMFDRVREKVFARSWQWIGSPDAVREPGEVLPLTFMEGLLNEPLLLSRDAVGDMHCLSNVCTHRGNLLVQERGKCPAIRCKYHGRRFGLDGTLQHMPEFEGVEDFPSAADHLPSLPLARLGPMLFTSLAPSLSAADWLRPVAERLAWMPFDQFRLDSSRTRDYPLNAHWALYCDNYLEGFHIPFVHPGLNAQLNYSEYETHVFPHGSLQIGIAREGETNVFDLPASSPDYGKRIVAYYYFLFPNLMLNFYPWGLSLNVVRPRGIDKTSVLYLAYVWKPERLQHDTYEGLHRTEMEDEAIVEMVQKGIGSRLYDRGRYSVAREAAVHGFHAQIAAHLHS
jgi:choline monooxygenase